MNTDNSIIEICHGPECGEYGGPELLQALTADGVKVQPGHCQGLCHYAPVASIGQKHIGDATIGKIKANIQPMQKMEL